MLCVKLTKYIYGMLRSAMLFYNKLRSHLEEISFEIKPYDPCVANMTINSSQITVCWNVDDLKVSHKKESAKDAFISKICNIFGNGNKVSRGKVHEYLRMDIYWYQDRTIIVSMIKYIQNISDTQ